MRAWTFFLTTFGCKVNQYESQALREAWTALGGKESADPVGADWIVLNTCAVTAQAVSDARQAVRRLHRHAPEAAIVITGCSASAAAPELAALPGVAEVVGQRDKERLLAGPDAFSKRAATPGPTHAASPSASAYPSFHISTFARARPVLKVQDGCSHGCTYCIVPLTRGPARSREIADVVAEAERLLAAGYREIMLSGINLYQYRVRTSGQARDFWDLVAALDSALAPAWQGQARLRLSSLDPAQLGAKAADVLGSARLICPHLHLSLQSGSPSVLRRMGRSHYDPQQVLQHVLALRPIWPLFGLGADVLMGFPGESEDECRETLALLNALPLSYAHIFPFSKRPGTAAAALPDLPGPEKQRRARLARELVATKQQAFLEHLLHLPELWLAADVPDSPDASGDRARPHLHGVTEYYAACDAGTRATPGHNLLRVRPTGIRNRRLTAVPF